MQNLLNSCEEWMSFLWTQTEDKANHPYKWTPHREESLGFWVQEEVKHTALLLLHTDISEAKN